jgi:hypothetical protein
VSETKHDLSKLRIDRDPPPAARRASKAPVVQAIR